MLYYKVALCVDIMTNFCPSVCPSIHPFVRLSSWLSKARLVEHLLWSLKSQWQKSSKTLFPSVCLSVKVDISNTLCIALWYSYWPRLLWCYHTTPHRTIGETLKAIIHIIFVSLFTWNVYNMKCKNKNNKNINNLAFDNKYGLKIKSCSTTSTTMSHTYTASF